MEYFHVGPRRYARFSALARQADLIHAFSMRPMDVSARDDSKSSERRANRELMARDLHLDPAFLCHTVQVHKTHIALVDEAALASRGPSVAGRRFEGFDALMTRLPGVALMTFSADCPLILVFDPVARAIGMVHSSWRCTVAWATRRLVESMGERFGSRAAALIAGIGPSAGPESYEVKSDVYDAAVGLPERDRLFRHRDGRMYFDLWEANRLQLLAAGLQGENIEVAGICTMTATDDFYSFRGEGAGCGHFGLMAGVRTVR